MMDRYDAIIIGAGHNGLVTAAYLAKAGKRVLVLERRDIIGGAAVTEEIYPGFKFSTCAYSCGLLPPRIVQELELNKNGLEILPLDPILFAPMLDGNHLLIWRETRKIVEEMKRFSKADAESYLPFTVLVKKLTALLRALWMMALPDITETSALDLMELLKLGWKFHKLGEKDMHNALRILPMCVADFLSEWFETDVIKGALAANGILGTFLGPRAQGTSYVFLHHHMGESNGAFRTWGLVRGGMGQLSHAIAQAAKHYGAEIRTNAEVAEVLIKNDAASGVALQNGGEISATMVISSADLKNTFMGLVDPTHLDPHFLLQVRNAKFRGACAKVNLALGELPNFKGLPGGETAPHHHGLIHIGPSIDYLERAFDDAKYGCFSKKPFLEIVIPSVTDSSLAPRGKHVMSVFMQYAPYHFKDGNWKEKREALGDLVVDTISEYAPNFKNSILHRHVLTPLDLEETYGLTEGNIYHGELSLDQLFFMRPVPGWARYRTPIKNLYLCGSGTHPGGGVSGIPGYNAARQILKDWRKLNR
ncbi:MAG: phytoene desaturase family protein [Candidatus Binatia bacterium]